MNRRSQILVGILAASCVAWGACSNDVEMPTGFHQNRLDRPTQVQATQDGQVLTVTWQLASTANVVGFVVEIVDATGAAHTRPVSDPTARTLAVDDVSLTAGERYVVRVWAVDATDASAFSGPPSAPDSLLAE